jgi:dGTPase
MQKLPLSREEIEAHETQYLAPYAVHSSKSKGRTYPIIEHPLRTIFQRDRDRIIHSTAFRRLEYKTQVFIPHEKDHFRTRLTHTIEVAQIARTLARNLRLNEDLAEAIALAHDLGHTPFGHSGEDVLDELLKDCGGFNHNHQSLRIVDLLEQRYPEHPGLNLSFEVREGIARHETKVDTSNKEFKSTNYPTLEASLVDIADEIAYNAHDIDDGLSSGILTFEILRNEESLIKLLGTDFFEDIKNNEDQKRYALVRKIINLMATDLINETQNRINKFDIKNLDDVRNSTGKACCFSLDMNVCVKGIKKFLYNKLYLDPKLKAMSQTANKIITTIFESLNNNPKLMPQRYQEMILTEEKQIVIADYIAGMTDRYAEKKYEELV